MWWIQRDPWFVWLQEGDTLSLDPDGSLGGLQPLGHRVDPHLQLTDLGSMACHAAKRSKAYKIIQNWKKEWEMYERGQKGISSASCNTVLDSVTFCDVTQHFVFYYTSWSIDKVLIWCNHRGLFAKPLNVVIWFLQSYHGTWFDWQPKCVLLCGHKEHNLFNRTY